MISPLSSEETDKVKAYLKELLGKLSDDAALRFEDAYQTCLAGLCYKIPDDIARGFPPTPDEAASLALSRPTYRTKFETTKTRARRSSVGVWYTFYWLIDGDGDRVPETLRVIAVRHGSAPPMWSETEPKD